MAIILENFEGYTLDFRLKQIRRVNWDTFEIEFIDFDSKEGKKILERYYKENEWNK